MILTGKQRKALGRILIASAATAALLIADPEGWFRLAAYLAVYLIIGGDILRKAWRGILNGRVIDENFLMAIATIGAFALAIYENSGDYLEAVAVMLFYQIGEFFQSYAVGKSRRNIASLMDIRPDYATVERDGTLVKVDPSEVAVGSEIVVQPGERIPIDGIVTDGCSSVDTSALTGESLPREVSRGSEVVSGCINLNGRLRLRTTRDYADSTVSRVLELVEESASRKSRSENFISRFARVYTPVVCYGALALAILPPLWMIVASGAPFSFHTFEPWVYRALVFLVISCPCALVISIPLSFFAGIGGASRCGILVKGGNILEALSKVDTVVFDKTGTLTQGVFEVVAFHDSRDSDIASETDKRRLLEYAAIVEANSSHPIARAVCKACLQIYPELSVGDMAERISGLHEEGGLGITATVDGIEVAVGNDRLMRSLGITPAVCRMPGTMVHVAIGGRYEGHIVLGDVVKPSSAEAIAALRRLGIDRTVMLTGDAEAVAARTAAGLGITTVYSRLMPADKVARLEEILSSEKRDAKVAFVGDGINDAPVLSRADIGIAMGALGSDAAIEAADVVLMDDDPVKIAKAVGISRRTMRIVRQNIVMAIGIKGVCLVLGAFGIVGMWYAIFADVGVMVLAVLNAMRCLVGRR
ncbi:MAG: cadmium-translocating P-type ATPase [Paramuribaculum sp.]|nr:cadmium-translocating P-type ATPase [Paramuribaculum sp.]